MNRLLIFTRSIPLHRIGGMEMLTWDLAKAFARQGVDVIVGTSQVAGRPLSFQHDGIQVETIPNTLTARYTSRFWAGTLGIYRRVENIDGILSVSSAAREVVLKIESRNVPVIMQAHGTSVGEMLTKWRRRSLKSWILSIRNFVWIFKDRVAMPRYDAVICVSAQVKKDFLHPWSLLGDEPKRYTIIDNGVDRTVFSRNLDSRRRIRNELGWTDSPVVVCACRLHAEKGVGELIRAFAVLAHSEPEARLLIIGDGPDRSRLAGICSQEGIEKKVHFTGALSRNDVAAHLSVGDAFAFLSMRMEGAPLNLLEALSVGLPSVLAAELIERVPGASGVWGVKSDDADQAAIAMKDALQYAAEGRSVVLPAKFSIDECATQYLAAFEVLSRSVTHSV